VNGHIDFETYEENGGTSLDMSITMQNMTEKEQVIFLLGLIDRFELSVNGRGVLLTRLLSGKSLSSKSVCVDLSNIEKFKKGEK